jgi:DNA-binding beta-propeller fold protein YncE
MVRLAVLLACFLLLAFTAAPERDYLVFVASEATDEIALIRFGPAGARVERTRQVGFNPSEPDGPHGLAISPDGRSYYVSTAHGAPSGYLWKFSTEGDSVGRQVELGMFPASLQVSPDGFYAYVVNFNLYGDMVPSSVSVVSTTDMLEIARLETCAMPHGSRFNANGSKHYSVCMMDDMLIEIDTRGLAVARHFMLARGSEHGMPGKPRVHAAGAAGGGHGMDPPAPNESKCSPTWAVPSPTGERVYVACNAANDIAEIDVTDWKLLRRIPAGNGVYNLALTHDGRTLIGTNKRDQSVSLIEVASGRELTRIKTKRTVVHGVAISDDDRYAFISVEGYGAEPGTVEVIDLNARRIVASVDVGQMAGGIDFWRSEPAGK